MSARRAAIYARISDDREGSGLGVKRQEADCRELCERRGWTVGPVLIDNDLSAYSGKPRPGYRELVEAIKERQIDVVVAWHPDRLTRSPRELEDLVELVEASGVTVATVTAGDYDLSTPTGRMVARVVGATARQESEHKAERNRRKARELAEAGKVSGGGTRPFGFEADRVTVRADEAVLVREAALRVLAGEPLRAVARDWLDRDITTPTGRPWAVQTFKRMLQSARISGRREHHGTITGPAEWDPIIDPHDSDRLRAILGAVAEKRAPRRYLLTGIARCGLCDASLVARPRQDGTRCYVCARPPGGKGCGKLRILAEPLETQIVAAVGARLEASEIPAVENDPSDPLAGLADLEARQKELAALWAGGSITRDEWLAARSGLDRRIEEMKRAAVGATRKQRATVALDRAWDTLDFDARRAVIELLVERVTVGPGRRGYNRYDPSRVTVAWV